MYKQHWTQRWQDRVKLWLKAMNNATKWKGWICAASSYNQARVQREVNPGKRETAERAHIKLDHKGSKCTEAPHSVSTALPFNIIRWKLHVDIGIHVMFLSCDQPQPDLSASHVTHALCYQLAWQHPDQPDSTADRNEHLVNIYLCNVERRH